MIAATDLRIENYIQAADGKIFQVRNIGDNGYVNRGYSPSRMLKYCVGIPLSPAILEKCGFGFNADVWGLFQ